MADPEQLRQLGRYGIAKTVPCMDCGAEAKKDCVRSNGLEAARAHRAREHQGHRHVRALIARLESQVAS